MERSHSSRIEYRTESIVKSLFKSKAIRSAVQSASRIFLQEYATACLLEIENGQDAAEKRQKMIHDMIALLDKAP